MTKISYNEYKKKLSGEQGSLESFGFYVPNKKIRSSLKLRKDEFIDNEGKVRRK